jgi:uncharacterized protein YbjT (DUF2867 family)
MTTTDERATLVLGGTGRAGRRIVERLQARQVPTRIGSRTGQPPFDWEDPDTWAPALDGARAVYISYSPDLAVPGAVEVVSSFAELAVERGVTRLVLLSGRGEPEAERAEEAVRASGAQLTALRSTWFSQNFSETFFLDLVLAGTVALPVGETTEPFVDVDDLADVAVAALTHERHIGEVYELTGPRLLGFADAVDEIARATGRELRFVSVSLSDFAEELTGWGVPRNTVDVITYVFGEVLDGRNSHVTDGVRRALGREPRDFRDYVRATAATGVWHPARSRAA